MLPHLEKITSLKAYVDHIYEFNMRCFPYYGYENFGNEYRDFRNEWLLQIKVLSCEEYIMKGERAIEMDLAERARVTELGTNNGYTRESYEGKRRKAREEKPTRIAFAKEIYSDHEWLNQVSKELECRKEKNLEVLETYGLDI